MKIEDPSLKLLELPTKGVNILRSTFELINVQLPAWLAQSLVFLIAIVLIYFFFTQIKNRKNTLMKTTSTIGLIIVSIMTFGIIYTWIDNIAYPPTGQIFGTIRGFNLVESNNVKFSILDFNEKNIGIDYDLETGTNHFIIHYNPVFADPPSVLIAEVSGCEISREYLNRSNLKFGTPINLSLNCTQ